MKKSNLVDFMAHVKEKHVETYNNVMRNYDRIFLSQLALMITRMGSEEAVIALVKKATEVAKQNGAKVA